MDPAPARAPVLALVVWRWRVLYKVSLEQRKTW
jgi:hypothetical protein